MTARTVLALASCAALAACAGPPAAGYRAESTATTSSSTTTEPPTTTTTATSLPPAPSTTAAPAPPVNPPSLVARPSASPGASGTTSASWYGAESGAHTANGDTYDPDGLTFAHRTMAFGTRVQFCRNGTCVVARCTDRGPASWTGRDFDLSQGTFARLAPLSSGVATVTWEQVG